MSGEEGDRVECYSGHTYAQRPYALILGGRRYPIDEVIEEWAAPDGKCFRVRVGEKEYLLSYLEEDDQWKVEPA